jgi:hypothetical protein
MSETATTLPAEITDQLIKVWELIHGVQWDLADFGTGYEEDDDDAARLSDKQFEKVNEFWTKLRQAAQTLEAITAASDYWREEDAA